MNWNNFKSKFHSSWHTSVKSFIESKDCDNIYTFLKSQKGKEIAPKSNLTFRAFESNLKSVKCVLMFEEPYSVKQNDIQYADGIPLSCEYVDRIHSQLNAFYEAMEIEFYDLNLNIIKQMHLDFYISQGVLFLNSSLTTQIGSPGSHKGLWTKFNKHLITGVFRKRNIPIIFCGNNVFKEYKDVLTEKDLFFVIKQSISECEVGTPWNTENVFKLLSDYEYDETLKIEIMWVNVDVPF